MAASRAPRRALELLQSIERQVGSALLGLFLAPPAGARQLLPTNDDRDFEHFFVVGSALPHDGVAWHLAKLRLHDLLQLRLEVFPAGLLDSAQPFFEQQLDDSERRIEA